MPAGHRGISKLFLLLFFQSATSHHVPNAHSRVHCWIRIELRKAPPVVRSARLHRIGSASVRVHRRPLAQSANVVLTENRRQFSVFSLPGLSACRIRQLNMGPLYIEEDL